MLNVEALGPEQVRPIRREEYDRLVSSGAFEDENVELLRGVLVVMSPQGALHAEIISRLATLFAIGLKGRAQVRSHSPLALGDDSEPEPDVAIVAPGDYRQTLPTTALLVIEVANSSLRKDRQLKAELYAEAQIPEYWVVDLEAHSIEVRRTPKNGTYESLQTAHSGVINPGAFPDLAVDVDKLFA